MTIEIAPGTPVARRPWRRLPGRVWAGAALAAPVVVIAVFGGFLAPHAPTDYVGAAFQGPGAGAPLGTDNLGHDVLSRLLCGGGLLLWPAVAATAVSVLCGGALGLVAGCSRGRAGEWIPRVVDVLLAFPALVLILMLMARAPSSTGLVVVSCALVLTPGAFRIMRVAAGEVAVRDFVAAARALGLGRIAVIRREILPNVTAPLFVLIPMQFIAATGLITVVNFLGLGVSGFTPSWGVMIMENKDGLVVAPLGVLAPVVAIAVLCVGINLVSDGIAAHLSRAAAAADS
ncbi:ABC transporter permease [Nocardia aurantia]|uniref:Glutathione transport system permease protein GsiD n=1 Tax=Nocardia aurantia TaxID=2585199 RepID=A0A7K0DKJ2_9NOCA|nr:ABC transporter permease [Nocardia aurantia]MQY26141.1 Glutathione transport system permease protein GsiD [Nocardia aurantia]